MLKNKLNKGKSVKTSIAIIGAGVSGLTTAMLMSEKYNITLFTNNDKCIEKLVPLLEILEVGYSDISIKSSYKEQQVEIKIKENIKLSSKFINDLSTISGIDHIRFS